jgi:SnoaL-like domain
VANKQAITEILGKLGWAYDTGHLDYFESIYGKDSRFTISIAGKGQVGDYQSLEVIMGLYRGAKAAQTDQRRHCVSNIFFAEETEKTATVISYLTLLATKDGVTKTLATGVYTDKFALVAGTWQIKHRDLSLDAPY